MFAVCVVRGDMGHEGDSRTPPTPAYLNDGQHALHLGAHCELPVGKDGVAVALLLAPRGGHITRRPQNARRADARGMERPGLRARKVKLNKIISRTLPRKKKPPLAVEELDPKRRDAPGRERAKAGGRRPATPHPHIKIVLPQRRGVGGPPAKRLHNFQRHPGRAGGGGAAPRRLYNVCTER